MSVWFFKSEMMTLGSITVVITFNSRPSVSIVYVVVLKWDTDNFSAKLEKQFKISPDTIISTWTFKSASHVLLSHVDEY